MLARGASPRCIGRCARMPGAFRPSPLVPSILVCRYCGAQQQKESLLPVARALLMVGTQPAQPTIYTVGYGGARLENLLRSLCAQRIEVLLDTRWSAWSQQQGFDATALRRALEGQGIAYRHLPSLGSAPDVRHQWTQDGNWDAFEMTYQGMLARQSELFGRVAGYAQHHRLCLFCAERDHTHCHRSLLATRLAELAGLQVAHLVLW